MTTPANPDDLLAFLHRQFENQRFRGESLKTLAFALPPETGAYLTETGELLLAEVDAKRRIFDRYEDCRSRLDDPDYSSADAARQLREYEDFVLPAMALPFAGREGFREEWRPA